MARSLLHDLEVFIVRERDLELPIPIDAEAAYHVRAITVEKGREIVKRHTRQRPNKRTHKMDDVTDNEQASNEMLDYCIVKWEGVKNGADPAPCDIAHKLLLPAEIQAALVQIAQVGQSDEQKAASFREPARVL